MPLGTRLKKLLHAKKMKKRARGTDGLNPSASIEPTPDQSAFVDGHEPNIVDPSSANTTPLKEAEKPDVKQLEPDNKSHSDDGRNNALSAIDAAINISLILRDASEASTVLIPLKISCTVLHAILQAAREKLVTHTNLESLIRRLEHHYTFIEEERRHLESNSLGEPPDEQLLIALEIYIIALEAGRAELTSPAGNAKKTGSYTATKAHVDPITVLEEEIEKGFRNLVRQVHNCILSATIKTSNGVAETRLSHLLRDSVDARGDRVKPLTLGTRLKIIQRLSAWGESSGTPERVFWLHDEAGTGKSSLAAHMAGHWEKEGVLLGRFFFNRNGGRDFRRLDKFCVSLIREMSDHHPLAKANFLEILGTHSGTGIPPFTEAFQSLVVSVAERLSKRLVKPLLFVIDALDECHEDDVQMLTASILNALPNCQGIRFLLTSRPTKEITAVLDGISIVGGKDVFLLDVRHGDAERDHDTSIYVRHILKGFSAADQNTVIRCASGVFLWATLACDTLLRTISPERVLNKFQNNQPDQTMQILYETALEAALPPKWSLNDMKLLHTVLQGVSLAYAPISIFSIRSFFPKYQGEEVAGEEFVEFFVKQLGSIMKDGTPYLPIYILHPTFREFIEGQRRGARFYISPPDGHRSIAMASLALLTESLTPDVLSLDDGKSPFPVIDTEPEPPARLSLATEAPLRYAVAFWATHASLAMSEQDEELKLLANKFFSSKFLVWLEWSSAIRELPECVEGLRRLRWATKLQSSSSKSDALMERWCTDSLRFLLHNGHLIEKCGLQAWMSALVFTPKHSLVFQTFSRNALRPLPRLLTQYRNISDGSRVIWDVKGPVLSTRFSPDGKRLLAYSGSSACLWNATSFKLIKSLSDGSTDYLHTHALAFSSDGSLIVSGNKDSTVSLFDGFTGAVKERLRRYHRKPVSDVAFMLSDKVVASIDTNQQICFWSVERTRLVRDRVRTVQGTTHSALVSKIAISPDRKMLATFSRDRATKLWDPETASMVGVAMMGTEGVRDGAFSIDGTKIVAGYSDGTIIIWDVESQNPIRSIASGSRSVFALAVSPDGRLIAAGNELLCLWDIETGESIHAPLDTSVWCVSFNHNGRRLICGSNTRQIIVWDIRRRGTELNLEQTVLKGHPHHINDVASSPSSRIIASASEDGTLRVWDMDLLELTDTTELPYTTHQKVHHMAASHDGSFLVSAGEGGNFQLWDFATGDKIGSLFHELQAEVTLLHFSLSNALWASAHSLPDDDNVCIWEYHREYPTPKAQVLPCKQGVITCLTFTHDTKAILIGGSDQSICIWGMLGRDCMARLEHTSVPRCITVSTDGRYLASGHDDTDDPDGGCIFLWDLNSYKLTGGPKSLKEMDWRLRGRIRFIAVSPDGTMVMIERMESLQFFNTLDMRYYARFKEDTRYGIPFGRKLLEPTFSSDGVYVFYGPYRINVAQTSRDSQSEPIDLSPEGGELPLSTVSPLYLDSHYGRVYSNRWKGALLALPADVRARSWVARQDRIALGSMDGRVFILRFPEECI